jgi:pilus assembly protein CpaD
MMRKSHVLLAAASLLALGACAQSATQIGYSSRAHTQISAREVTAELKIDTVVANEKLGPDAREAVKYFAAAYEDEGHGALVISRPTNGPNDLSASRAANDARAVMLAEGLDASMIVEGPYDATGARSAPLVISYKTWEAYVPNCPDVSHFDFANMSNNSALPSFGCATAVNLAAMVANPRDLVSPAQIDPSDTGRRVIQMTKYRNGETTGAARSEDASGAVSAAGN